MNIDVAFQIDRLTPPYKRTPKLLSWLNALLKPLQENNNDFIDYTNVIIRNTKITSQKIVFEKVLSEWLNITGGNPQVILENVQVSDDFLIGEIVDYSSAVFSAENFTDIGIYENSSNIKVNFKIKVPALVWNALTTLQKQEFKAYVNTLKLYGTKYLIETY